MRSWYVEGDSSSDNMPKDLLVSPLLLQYPQGPGQSPMHWTIDRSDVPAAWEGHALRSLRDRRELDQHVLPSIKSID